MFDLFRNERMKNSVEKLREVHHFNKTSTHSIFGDIDDVSTEFRRSFKISEKFENHYTCDLTRKPPDSLNKNLPEIMEALFALTPENIIKHCQPDSTEIKHVLSKFDFFRACGAT